MKEIYYNNSGSSPLLIAAIIQARMGASRLPGKPLKEVLGKPLLFYLIERLKQSKMVGRIVVATTVNPKDEQIATYADTLGIDVFFGDEENVLARYNNAASHVDCDVIVRITADCPLMDPTLIDEMVKEFLFKYSEVDYLSNTIERTFPRGLDIEIFSREALTRAAKEAKTPFELEHVTPYFYQHPHLFRISQFLSQENESHYRWTVDTEEDFELIKRMIEALYPINKVFNYPDMLELMKKNPEWVDINRHVQQKLL